MSPIRRCLKMAAAVLLVAAACALVSVPAAAATFEIVHDGGPVIKAGGISTLNIIISPGAEEKVIGAICTLSADPAMIEFPADRNEYAADPAFGMVEKFKVSPEKGTITFHAKSDVPLSGRTVFLKAPFKVKKPGAAFISFTSTVLYPDNARAASNPGYFRVVGYEGDEVDPVLYATVMGDNVLLTTGSLENRYEVVEGEETRRPAAQVDLGLTTLQVTEDESAADVVIGFSKSYARVGVNKFVRLDIVIEKFPEYEFMTGIELKVKYDPRNLMFVDRRGKEASEVEILEPLDELTLGELQKMLEKMGLAAPKDAKEEELRATIDAARRWDYRSIFKIPFANYVDKTKGEITLSLMVDLMLAAGEFKTPHTVVTLLFKGTRGGENIPVTMENVQVPIGKGTQFVRNAKITIDPDQKACDETLPASLCSGTFKITGNLQLALDRQSLSRKTLVGTYAEKDGGDYKTEDTKIEKLSLQQSWNVFLDGSFRNGVTVTGAMSESPGQPEQHMDVELAGRFGTVRFGSFNTNFESGTMVSLDKKKINGVQFDYQAGDLEFAALLAEARSTTKTATITGNDVTGPYKIQSDFVIPGTLHIFDKKGVEISTSQYRIDYRTGEIYFSEPVPKSEARNVSYEVTTLLLSTGNMRAYRLGYRKKASSGRGEKLKLGASYLVASAPKSSTNILNDEQTLNLADTTLESVNCPYNPEKTCVRINLNHPYILKGSMDITSVQGSKMPSETAGPVYTGHRGYLIGRLYIERGSTEITGNVTVRYSYYNPDLIYDTGLMIYSVPANGFEKADSVNFTGWSWPSNAFPGSEIILLSDNDSSEDKTSDVAICEGKPVSGTDAVYFDEPAYCPGSYDRTLHERGDGVYYEFFDAGTDSFLDFSRRVDIFGKDADYIDYKYLKVRYFVVPTDLPTGSEFTKTAMGLTGEANLGRRLTVTGEYAQTNSDLAASYGTNEDQITVDADTFELGGYQDGDLCTYNGTNEADRTLVCNLQHGNLVGSVKLSVRHCERVDGDPNNSCLCDRAGVDPGNDCYDSKTQQNYILYQPTTYDIARLYFKGINSGGDGKVVLYRKTTGKPASGYPSDPGFSENGHYFPRKFDQLIVNYVYDRSLGTVVDGGSYNLKADYRGKRVNMSITKRNTDPFFDTSIGGSKQALSNTSSLNFLMNTVVGKWKLDFSRSESENESIRAETLSPISQSSSITRNFSAFFNDKGWLRNFGINSNTGTRYSASNLGTTSRSLVETKDTSTTLMMTTVHFRDALTLNSGIKLTNVEAAGQSELNTSSLGKSLNVNYKATKNLKLISDYKDSRTTADQSESETTGRNNSYTLQYTPWELLDINTQFTKSVSGGAGKTYSVTENTNYTVRVLKAYHRVSGMTFTFSRQQTPTEYQTSKSDSRSMSFRVELPRDLTWAPTYTRSVSGVGSGWRQTTSRNWSLNYKPKGKKITGASWSRTSSSSRSAVEAASQSQSGSRSDNLSMSVVPGSKSSLTSTYSRTPSSFSHRFSLSCRYEFRSNLNFNVSFSRDHKGGTALTRTTTYSFDTFYKLNTLTSFSLRYDRNLVRDNNPNARTDTKLRATLNTRFE